MGGRKIGGKWKFSEARRRKNAAQPVLVDRHALKKITVSTGILQEEERTGQDTPGSQRTTPFSLFSGARAEEEVYGFLNTPSLSRPFEFHDFC